MKPVARTTQILVMACFAAALSGCTAEVNVEPDAPAKTTAVLDRTALDHPSRTEDDRFRDKGFKPLEVYEFFEVTPGTIVADIWPGRGYHTHLLSLVMGEDGRVLSVLGPLYLDKEYEEWVRGKLTERIDAGQLKNVEVVGPLSDIEDESIDVMITVRNYHDLGDEAARIAVLPDLMRILKPGGVFGVVEAYTPKEGVDEPFHRINEDLVIREITGAGFALVERSDILVNPDDTYDFDGREDDAPINRYYIHRMVHKYRKPVG